MSENLENQCGFRLSDSQLEQVRACVRKRQDLFDSEAHFYRCAVLRLIQQVRRGGDL